MKPASEQSEQMALIKWAKLNNLHLIHIPNEGERSAYSGAMLKKMGLAKGFPDIFYPRGFGGFYGLFIEMKQNRDYTNSERNTKTWRAQFDWLLKLSDWGYKARFAFGWEDGMKIIQEYNKLEQMIDTGTFQNGSKIATL